MWKKVRLGDVCSFIGGSQPAKSCFEYVKSEKNIRLIQIRDYKSDKHIVYIPKEKARRFCSKSDVMIGRYGPPIFQILKGIEGAYNVALMKAVPKEGLCNDYLYYFLKNNKLLNYVIAQSSRAAGQSGVKKEALEDYPLLLPSLEEQQRIVAKLDSTFAEIDTLISNIQRNKINLKAFYTKERNQIFKELCKSEKSVKLKEVVDISRGQNPPKSQFINIPKKGYVRFYQIRDAKSDKYATYVPESQKLKKVSKNDFLMNAYRHIGEVFTGAEGAFNVALCKLSIKDIKTLEKDFLYFMIPSYLIKGRLLQISERSLIPSMSVKELAEINIPIPILEKQIEVSSRLKKIEKKINEAVGIVDQKYSNLIALKSSFISSYMELSHL